MTGDPTLEYALIDGAIVWFTRLRWATRCPIHIPTMPPPSASRYIRGVAGSPARQHRGTSARWTRRVVAKTQINTFFGTTSVADAKALNHTGLNYRDFIFLLAWSVRVSAGARNALEAIEIGSELRGLTQVRDDTGAYPAVDQLVALAQALRTMPDDFGAPSIKIGYAADWSEYFGHQTTDGTGDGFFPSRSAVV